MQLTRGDDHIDRFVLALLDVGSNLGELVCDLAEALPDDTYPGEEPIAVVLEMLCGTIATALKSVDPRDVRRASELMELARARALEHLQLACNLSRRIHGDESSGRAYG